MTQTTVITIAGDSGDGVQLLGSRFTTETARTGSDFATLPEFPAEIRAPVGSLFGVSSYSLNFSDDEVRTAGDETDLLVALNPAALKVGIRNLALGKSVIIDSGSFSKRALKKAKYEKDPRHLSIEHKDSLAKYKVIEIDITHRTLDALSQDFSLSRHEALRSKNMWILGFLLQVYGFNYEKEVMWLSSKFDEKVALINKTSLIAGYNYADITEFMPIFTKKKSSKKVINSKAHQKVIKPAIKSRSLTSEKLKNSRTVIGAETVAWGLIAGAVLLEKKLLFASYPITPASPVLQILAKESSSNNRLIVRQAEDEIAAAGFALGASYAGSLGVTATSGPGLDLISETLALAQTLELPLIAIDIMRAGPSTGMPTKPEQSDLEAAIYGRHGESPIPVLAVRSAKTAFNQILDAIFIAYSSSSPIIILSDSIINSSSRIWQLPELQTYINKFTKIINNAEIESDLVNKAENFDDMPDEYKQLFENRKHLPYKRISDTLTRLRAIPGQKFFQHRLGGLEKELATGIISYDDKNHQEMTKIRQKKVEKIVDYFKSDNIELGDQTGQILIITFGSVAETCYTATQELLKDGYKVSLLCLSLIYPLDNDIEKIINRFKKVIICEMNSGHLYRLIRQKFLNPCLSFTKVSGKPFKIKEVIEFVKMNYNAD